MKKKQVTRKVKVILLSSLVLGSFLIGERQVNAEPILNAPKVEVPTKDTIISNKYDFIGEAHANTKLKTFGDVEWIDSSYSGTGTQTMLSVYRPTDDMKGDFGVIYENVGIFDGRVVDLKITITDWDQYFNDGGVISFSKNRIINSQTGYNDVYQEWTYLYHDTKEVVDMSGTFMTFADIDNYQRVSFKNSMSNKIDKIFVSEDSWLDYETDNEKIVIQSTTGDLSEEDDDYAMFTALFDSSSINFGWGVHYDREDNTQYLPESKVVEGVAGKEYFIYSAKKPARTELDNPTKTVTDSDEVNQESNTLSNIDETFSYKIYHNVPDEREEFYYSSYEISDSVIDELEIVSDIKVVNEADKDVTDFFENKTEGNNIHLVAKEESLKNPDFYFNTFIVNFDTKIRSGANLDKYKEDDAFKLPNIAKVTTEGGSKDSNETITTLKPDKDPLKDTTIEKFIKKNDKQETSTEAAFSDVIDFVFPIYVTNENEKLESLIFYDDLDENVFDVKQDSIQVFSSDEKEVTDQFDIGFDKTTQKVMLTAKEPTKWVGQQLVVTLSASLKDGELEDYLVDGKYQFTNIGNVVVDGKDTSSNEVKVTVPKSPEKEVVTPKPDTPKTPDKEVAELPQTGTDNTKMIGYSLLVLAGGSVGAYGVVRYRQSKQGE